MDPIIALYSHFIEEFRILEKLTKRILEKLTKRIIEVLNEDPQSVIMGIYGEDYEIRNMGFHRLDKEILDGDLEKIYFNLIRPNLSEKDTGMLLCIKTNEKITLLIFARLFIIYKKGIVEENKDGSLNLILPELYSFKADIEIVTKVKEFLTSQNKTMERVT